MQAHANCSDVVTAAAAAAVVLIVGLLPLLLLLLFLSLVLLLLLLLLSLLLLFLLLMLLLLLFLLLLVLLLLLLLLFASLLPLCSNRSASATSGARCDLPPPPSTALSGERHLRPQQGASLNEFNPKQFAVQQFCKYTPLIKFLPLLPAAHDFIGNYSNAHRRVCPHAGKHAIQLPSCPSRRLSCCSAVSGSSSSSEWSENSCT